MKSMRAFIFYLFFCVLIALLSMPDCRAQTRVVEVVPSSSVHMHDDKPWFIHPVKQGETLYSISRAYSVSQEQIMGANPDLVHGLRFDQTIMIPAFAYEVQARETAFGLSRQFGLSLQQLYALNPDILIDGLKIGMVLYLPGIDPGSEPEAALAEQVAPITDAPVKKPETEKEQGAVVPPITDPTRDLPRRAPDTTYRVGRTVNDTLLTAPATTSGYHEEQVRAAEPCPHAVYKSFYNVALLIPLYLEEISKRSGMGNVASGTMEDDNLNLRHKSFSFLPYYHGVLIALDSIRSRGVDIRLHVFDVDQNEAKAREAVNSFAVEMDLIIGPFFSKTLDYIAGYALHHDIPVVSPLLPSRQQLINFPNLFNAVPSLEMQLGQLARHIGYRYGHENIILVHNDRPEASNFIDSFRQALNRQLAIHQQGRDRDDHTAGQVTPVLTYTPTEEQVYFKELIYIRSGMPGLIRAIEPGKQNIIITLIDGEAFLSNYLRELNIHASNLDAKVFGIPNWREYHSVEIDYLQNLNVHIFVSDFQDYSEQHIKDFVARYRNEFGTEPTSDAFRAIHTAYFFFTALDRYGESFAKCMYHLNNSVIHSPFDFQKSLGNANGWENACFTLIKFEDFRMVDVSP